MPAWATYWTGRPDATIEALERAYAAYLDEGDRAQAAMMAYRLAEQHGMRMSIPLAQGWGRRRPASPRKMRPGRCTAGCSIQGLLLWIMEQDYAGAIQHYDEALAFAERIGDRDLAAMSLHDKGHALCLLGDVATGMPLLDECMATVVGGELDPAAAGYVYCGMIGVCSKLGDYGRASEWTEATLRWCERRSVPAFPGVCRIHRAEPAAPRRSARRGGRCLAACEELPLQLRLRPGPRHYEIGEVRRQLGDFVAAEEAYARPRRSADHRSRDGRCCGWPRARSMPPRRASARRSTSRRRYLRTGPTAGRAGRDRPRERRCRDGDIRRGRARHARRGVPNGLTPCDGRRRAGCAILAGGDLGSDPDPAASSGWQEVEALLEAADVCVLLAERTPPAEMTMRREPRRDRHGTRSNASGARRARREPGACSIGSRSKTSARSGSRERSCSRTSCGRPT